MIKMLHHKSFSSIQVRIYVRLKNTAIAQREAKERLQIANIQREYAETEFELN